MHYIRLLRPPSLVVARTACSFDLVLAITTDLGESFLCPDQPVGLSVVLEIDELVASAASAGEKADEKAEAVDGAGDGPGDQAPTTLMATNRRVWTLAAATSTSSSTAAKAGSKHARRRVAGSRNAAAWQAGLRVLKLTASLPPDAAAAVLGAPAAAKAVVQQRRRCQRLCIRPADAALTAVQARQLVAQEPPDVAARGLIMPLWVDVAVLRPANATAGGGGGGGSAVATWSHHVAPLRRLSLGGPAAAVVATVDVEEDIGESIARHVWDAGLVAVAFLAHACLWLGPPQRDAGLLAATLRSMLVARRTTRTDKRGLRVLELGCGVGILGIGVAAILQAAAARAATTTTGTATVLLTDLPEAEERAAANIARFYAGAADGGDGAHPADDTAATGAAAAAAAAAAATDNAVCLAYENLDWEDGRCGVFGARVRAGQPWDLVLLSDCTYNVDMLPALVTTLTALHAESAAAAPATTTSTATTTTTTATTTNVLLARKPRHASEVALFPLLTDHGWTRQACSTVPLPILGGSEAETVELYLYSKTG
ncbi:hypothetical protein SPI_06789 [Niveomyces insectorum RCEF 264]|uniref:Uncharacterized protein n=1 Tax=Niveomyces insectorum RCEF 264 TaxID=1081102 RepID=A0A167QRR2_9HYPO|nr:hypothetical protein SPI_06789 [Niveomyces insectorum RCEF 264]